MGEVVAHRMTPDSQKESEPVDLCQIYDNSCALNMHGKCERKGSRQQEMSADCTKMKMKGGSFTIKASMQSPWLCSTSKPSEKCSSTCRWSSTDRVYRQSAFIG